MQYPTYAEVRRANREQLARWYRFLPSPGSAAVGKPEFEETLAREAETMNLIIDRFYSLGGMSPSISKQIGWE